MPIVRIVPDHRTATVRTDIRGHARLVQISGFEIALILFGISARWNRDIFRQCHEYRFAPQRLQVFVNIARDLSQS